MSTLGASTGMDPNRARPKVIHVTTTDMSLGWLLGPQLRAFRDAGFEVVGASAPGPHVRALEQDGIRHIALRHATRAMAPAEDLRGAVELFQLFRHERPDIVHTHNPKPGWFGRVAAGLARTPVVVNTVHGLYATPDDPLARRAVVYGLERVASAFSDAELVQSYEDVAVLTRLRVPKAKITVLGNGIDLDQFGPTGPSESAVAAVREELGGGGEGSILVGAVGRLVWEKGLREVFSAAERLRRIAPRAKVVVVGPLDPAKADGIDEAQLRQISADTGILFAGERSDMATIYRALDIYVLASHREGFPRSAMEASATGIPVIASDIRGCRQVVDHGVTGLLFPVGDAAALADSVARLVENDDERALLGRGAAAKAIREFDQRTVIDITLATYERLLKRSTAKYLHG